MRFPYRLFSATIVLVPIASTAQEPSTRSAALKPLLSCSELANGVERLRCFDREVAVLDQAERKRDIVLIDRAEVNRTRRSLFGFKLPSSTLLGRDDDAKDAPAFSLIETTLIDAKQSGRGWIFTVQDGARWAQTDTADLDRTPKRGQSIRIRRGALGSYLANIEKQAAIRVRRIE